VAAFPLVNLGRHASRSFAAGSALSLVYFAGFIGLPFVLSLYLQIGLGWSPLHAGLAILPFAAGTFGGAAVSDGLAHAPNVEVVLSGVSWQDAGSAAGVLNTCQRLGQAIGIAVVGVAFFGSLGTSTAPGQAA
jgi:hypothetical protein